ncbi:MAG: hypothetical protein GWM98_21130, partial [Nitrospinaceae bacterium]|nr:hypothetical protein [Nitrospinaceae bacterium]
PATNLLDLTDPVAVAAFHPPNFRDVNLDGMVDSGALIQKEAHYQTGRFVEDDDGEGDYPFNRQRYMEDLIEAWDFSEDFTNSFVGPVTGEQLPLYAYGIYPAHTNFSDVPGFGVMGGAAGANIDVLTLDTTNVFNILFQIRPQSGGG